MRSYWEDKIDRLENDHNTDGFTALFQLLKLLFLFLIDWRFDK